MSETIKLIIEIPKELHEALLKGYEEPYSREFSDVVKKGTSLDTVKAEIFDKAIINAKSGDGFIFLGRLLRIFDNIGKESEVKPNET